jgi:putative ABC transport system permease protein
VLDIALRMLFYDRGKLVITLCGVAFAVTLVFVQVGLFRGLLGNATVTIERASADLWVTSRNTPNIDFPNFFPESSVHRVRSVPGVLRADNLFLTYVSMQLPTGAQETVIVYGIDDPAAWNLPWSVIEGSAESIRTGRTMLLDDSATRRFGPFQVGDYRELFGRRLQIMGRTSEALSFTTIPIAFTSVRVGQELQEGLFGGRASYILVKLAPGADRAAVAAEMRQRLPYNDVLASDEWAQRTRDYWVVSTGLGMNMALTVFLGILVGVTVVAQTLYAATLDHTREFGTLKAIGATSGHVCGLVAIQAALAGVAGYLLALPVVWALRIGARRVGLEVVISPSLAAMVFVGSLALCLGASLLTFRRIVSIDPALVFRS